MMDDDFKWDEEEEKPIDTELIKRYMTGAVNDEKHSEAPGKNPKKKSQIQGGQKQQVDLHWPAIPPSFRKGFEDHKIEGQKNFLQHMLEVWRKNGCRSARIIHGKGDGVLAQSVWQIVENHPSVRQVKRVRFNREAGAATDIVFF